MIQEIEPRRLYNEYKPTVPVQGDAILYFQGQEAMVCRKDGTIDFPRFGKNPPADTAYTYLFKIDDTCFFLSDKPVGEDETGCGMMSVRAFRGAVPGYMAFAGITAWQLYSWYKDNCYCGACGGGMCRDGKERMLSCAVCGSQVYPKISPAVIVAVKDDDRLLMTRYAGRDYTRYALVAGFAEIGETIEQTVRREVMEEVGLRVKNIQYYKSQPWSFSGSLLLGFYADVDGSTDILLDTVELSEAVWVPRDKIDTEFDGISLTNEMITRFKDNGLSGVIRDS